MIFAVLVFDINTHKLPLVTAVNTNASIYKYVKS